ncbi:MAG: DUF1501 domain-containing protein [Gemmataceae bacterium]|nr:DUF1501 domain-containing protein [Gemmataceae bacterium]
MGGNAFASPFTFGRHGLPGLEVSDAFPELAKRADDLCLIRSMHTGDPSHETQLLMMNCGHPRLVRPSVGGWVTYGLGPANRNLPAFVALYHGGPPPKGPRTGRPHSSRASTRGPRSTPSTPRSRS